MKTYRVKIFALGCDPKLTSETILVDAQSQEKAEALAVSGSLRSGYGVLESHYIHEKRDEAIIEYVTKLLLTAAGSEYAGQVARNILEDILQDVEECADWSDLDEDEFVPADVDLALGRVLLHLSEIGK